MTDPSHLRGDEDVALLPAAPEVRLTRRRRGRGTTMASLSVAVVVFLALNALVWSWRGTLERERKENLLLASHVPAGVEARYDWSSGESLGSFLPHVPDATRTRLVIAAGMSQMYAINDRKPGDQTISEHLDDALSAHDARSFGVAAPNLHNGEALFLFEALAARPETKPAVFVYGVCFDKFRNVDLRPGYVSLLRDDSTIADQWKDAAATIDERFPLASREMRASLAAAVAEPASSTDVSLEARIRDAAAEVVPLVAARREVSSFLQMRLFLFRNWLFNITPTSKRPVIASRYELNWQFLEALAVRARENGVALVLYVNPLNPQSENPYIPEQYERFKRDLEAFCNEQGIPFANLEDVVPAEHWGEFMGGPDFKHFRGEGHLLTAQAIYEAFGPVLLGKAEASP